MAVGFMQWLVIISYNINFNNLSFFAFIEYIRFIATVELSSAGQRNIPRDEETIFAMVHVQEIASLLGVCSNDWFAGFYSIASASFMSPLRISFTTDERSISFFEAIFSTKVETSSSR